MSNLLSDKHDWPVVLRLLGISSMVQRDISKHCFAHRCYYETVDAFECSAIQLDHARTPEMLLEKLQQKLPDLREELAGCLKAAQSFEIPKLSKYGIYVDILQWITENVYLPFPYWIITPHYVQSLICTYMHDNMMIAIMN